MWPYCCYSNVMPYATHIFFATQRSYVPFKLHKNTHFEIRSGKLQITSQHWNIVNAKKPDGLCDRQSSYHKRVIGDRWCLVNYARLVGNTCIRAKKCHNQNTYSFGLETITSEHPTHFSRSSLLPGFPISVGPKTSSTCSFSNLQTYPMTISWSLYYSPM